MQWVLPAPGACCGQLCLCGCQSSCTPSSVDFLPTLMLQEETAIWPCLASAYKHMYTLGALAHTHGCPYHYLDGLCSSRPGCDLCLHGFHVQDFLGTPNLRYLAWPLTSYLLAPNRSDYIGGFSTSWCLLVVFMNNWRPRINNFK